MRTRNMTSPVSAALLLSLAAFALAPRQAQAAADFKKIHDLVHQLRIETGRQTTVIDPALPLHFSGLIAAARFSAEEEAWIPYDLRQVVREMREFNATYRHSNPRVVALDLASIHNVLTRLDADSTSSPTEQN